MSKSLENLLEHWSKGFAVLGTLTLAGSVAHDYAFLWRLGLSFAEVPTTLQDHARSLIVWAPAVAVLTVVMFVIASFSAEERTKAEDEDGESDRGRRPPLGWPLFTFTAMPTVALALDRGLDGLVAALPVLALLLILTALHWRWIPQHWPTAFRALLCLGFFLGSVVFASGLDQGQRMITSDVAWLVRYRSTAGGGPEQVRGVRQFGGVTVVVDTERIVHVVPSSEIAGLSRVEHLPIRERNVCAWFGVLCDK